MKTLNSESKEEPMKIDKLTRRATTFGASVLIGLATFGAAGAADAQGAKGKTVEYIAFGLQFEYQVALVNGIKKRAADAGVALHVIDGKGDPNYRNGGSRRRHQEARRAAHQSGRR
jgi:ribose transport system substrate-binding protein